MDYVPNVPQLFMDMTFNMDKADKFHKCANSLMKGPGSNYGPNSVPRFVNDKFGKYNHDVPTDKIKEGADMVGKAVDHCKTQAAAHWELAMVGAEILTVLAALWCCHKAAQNSNLSKSSKSIIERALTRIQNDHFSSEAAVQALLSNPAKLQELKEEITELKQSIADATSHANWAKGWSVAGTIFSVIGTMGGGYLAATGTSTAVQAVGVGGAVVSVCTGVYSGWTWMEANAMLADLQGYDEWLSALESAIDDRRRGVAITDERKEDLFQRSWTMKQQLDLRRAQRR